MTHRPLRPRAYAPDPEAPGRQCDVPGCGAAGEYRAPKSRKQLRDYWWFCLEHVRTYNAAWDFYKGMTSAQIEAELRADSAWQRPTWPLGHLGTRLDEGGAGDLLFVVRRAGRSGTAGEDTRNRKRREAPADMRESLATLGLAWPLTLSELKSRYKQLAKQHHPDANNGSREAEERLKVINLAYATLRGRLARASPWAAAG
jgi:hypothetical protein